MDEHGNLVDFAHAWTQTNNYGRYERSRSDVHIVNACNDWTSDSPVIAANYGDVMEALYWSLRTGGDAKATPFEDCRKHRRLYCFER